MTVVRVEKQKAGATKRALIAVSPAPLTGRRRQKPPWMRAVVGKGAGWCPSPPRDPTLAPFEAGLLIFAALHVSGILRFCRFCSGLIGQPHYNSSRIVPLGGRLLVFRDSEDLLLMQERWLSVHEIAAHLGVNRDTIYKWIVRKKMPAHKVGRLWKFTATEVDTWVRAGKAAGDDHHD